MAMVDFSNARIEPLSKTDSINPTYIGYIGFNTSTLRDTNGNIICSNNQLSQLMNQQKQFMYIYQGTFTTSGTEFYMITSYAAFSYGWKISNISFQEGDTYVFQINANLVCN